jgi:hypothetical protein
MKRRMFGVLGSTSLLALRFGYAHAQTAVDPHLLKTTLTPMGAERAGNSDGSIPAWDGGAANIPLPANWQPGQAMPDLFADEQPILVIDANNMAQHADRLSEGTMAMMTKYGFSIKVYPSHRTAAAPQAVYDNIAANALSSKLNPGGGRLGFSGGFGGIPFPIIDTSDPAVAGGQLVWNHSTSWKGYAFAFTDWSYVMNHGQLVNSNQGETQYKFPYYLTRDTDQYLWQYSYTAGPPNIEGQEILAHFALDPSQTPNATWQLLNGQGRVRKSPETQFDTPSPFADGFIGFDEYYGFDGSPIQYDWTLVAKKEMYIPYNNNALILQPAEKVHLDNFLDPNFVRWELHRVWVVDATIHPGERNVLHRRRLYFDEDISQAGIVDAWDANGTLVKVNHCFTLVRPDVPANTFISNVVYNLQLDAYCTPANPWNEAAKPTCKWFSDLPNSTFSPNNMAASGQY